MTLTHARPKGLSALVSANPHIKKVPFKSIHNRIEEVLEECSLKDVRSQLIATLSKGYQQRVGIAQAIVNNPQVLILDEPTNGLDPLQILQVRKLIKNLETHRTVILSTHILSEVAATCDRIIVIDRGKLVAQEDINAMGVTGNTSRTEVVVQKLSDTSGAWWRGW